MNDERTPSGASQEPTIQPENSPIEHVHEPPSMGMEIALAVLVLLAGIAVCYGWWQHESTKQLSAEREELRIALAQAKSQTEALSAKVNALSTSQAQEESAALAQPKVLKTEPENPSAPEAQRHVKHLKAAHRTPAEDLRWKQIQSQLTDQQKLLADHQKELADNQKEIADTEANLQQAKSDLDSNLQSARTELGGGIARNHAELVELQKKGERNYYEFSVEKSKSYHHTGPISIELRKADSKHAYCDLQFLVDDKEITRKHVNLYELINYYPEGFPLPVEVVINHIDKNSVKGYVSEPKYRNTERAGASAAPASPAPASAPAAAAPDVPTATTAPGVPAAAVAPQLKAGHPE